jgi:uncharacterized protein
MDLSTFFKGHPGVALAFSGGADSAYLLYAAIQYGAKVRAYTVRSAFQPEFELNDARRAAAYLNADLKIIEADVLSVPEIASNPADRCYHCKKLMLSAIAREALRDGFETLIDGTNASDATDSRPGMRALNEFSVHSPLRECGLTKDEIRRLSKEAGLYTWNKPAYACLATRVPTGEPLVKEKLECIERAENDLFSLGFSDFRVRAPGAFAKIQLPANQFELLMQNRGDIVKKLRQYFDAVLLDLEERDES